VSHTARKELIVSDRWRELCRSKTWIDILGETAQKFPDDEALVFGDQRTTYREYAQKVNEYAKALYSIGVRSGDHVGIWMTNRPEWCYARHAIYKLGAVMIPISTRYRGDDLDYILGQSDTKILIMEPNFLGKIDSMGIMRRLCPELGNSKPGEVTSTKYPLLKAVVSIDGSFNGCFTIDEVLKKGAKISENDINIGLKPDDLIHIIYTSGTTGFPKGIMTPTERRVSRRGS